MKLFQKAAAAVLALTMSFSLFACDGSGNDSESKQDSSSSVSTIDDSSESAGGNTSESGNSAEDSEDTSESASEDNGSESSESNESASDSVNSADDSGNTSGGDDPVEEGEGAKYLEGAIDALRESNTITLNFEFKATLVDPILDLDNLAKINVDCTFAKTEDGYNMHARGTVGATGGEESTGSDSSVSVYATESYREQVVDVYIVDGFLYTYDAVDGWDKVSLDELFNGEATPPGIQIVISYVSMIYDAIFSEDADLSEVYEVLGPVLEEYCTIENDTYVFELDVKDEVNGALSYLANLDYTQTVEAYLNGILENLGAEITVKDILDEVAACGSTTVGQIYETLNGILEEEIGMDVKGLKDEVVTLMNLYVENLPDAMPEEVLAELQQAITMIEELDVDALVKEYATVTVDDIIYMYIAPGAEGDSSGALKQLTDMAYQTLSTATLADVLASAEIDVEYLVKNCSTLSITDLGETLSIKFNNYKISTIDYSVKAGFIYNDEVTMNSDFDASASFKAAFSNEVTEIKLPDEAADL